MNWGGDWNNAGYLKRYEMGRHNHGEANAVKDEFFDNYVDVFLQ